MAGGAEPGARSLRPFFRHRFVACSQKARFLPAASARCAPKGRTRAVRQRWLKGFSMAPDMETAPISAAPAPARRWLRVALLGTLGAGAVFALILFAYELARARVPQHRAALERLVRAQTGLDVRFTELGLRWGWYGPEAVFRHVELGEPGNSQALLRAPELVVGFDAWRTLRSGHPEAGRIELIAPEIDLSSGGGRRGVGAVV